MSELDPDIEAYLDKTMDADAMERFSRRLAEDPDLARVFVEAVRFDVGMRNQFRGEVEVDDLMLAQGRDTLTGFEGGHDRHGWLDGLAALADAAGEPQLVDATSLLHEREAREKRRQRKQAAMRARQRDQWQGAQPAQHRLSAALLVAAAVLLLLGLGLWFSVGPTPVTSPPMAENDPPASVPGAGGHGVVDGGHTRDTGVVLTQRSSPTWGQAPDTPSSPEGTLAEGTYRLDAGVAELSYPSGAVVTVLGPAEVELTRRNGMSVVGGKVLCDVPTGAAQFQLDTGGRRLTSRGGRLGLHVGGDQVASYVFSGTAEYRHGQEQLVLNQADRLLAQASRLAVVRADALKPNDLPEDFAGFEAFARGRTLVAEPFDQAADLGRFAVTQGYIADGGTPGQARVRSGRLALLPGGNNTVCCYMDSDGQAMPIDTRWVVDLTDVPEVRGDEQLTLFLCLSTSPAQPGPASAQHPSRNGSAGFRLRYEVVKHGLRVESDGASPDAFTNFDQFVSGTLTRLAISRISEDRFGFWCMYEGEDQWRLIGEQDHAGLDISQPLYVGVEAYSWYRGRSIGLDNLRLETIPN